MARRQQGRQHQQAEQKHDVVDADPDVPHPFNDVTAEHPPGAAVCAAHLRLRALGAEQGAGLQSRQIDFQQAAVKAVLRKHQAITQA